MPFLFSAHVKRRPGSCHKLGGLWSHVGRTVPCDDWHRSSTGGEALKIAIGGLIALTIIGYVASQWKKFD